MYEQLPQELKDYPYFCGWKYELVKGNRTKAPKSVKGHNADIGNLTEFCSLDEALEKSLDEVEDTMAHIKSQEITKDNVLRFILDFGRAYNGLSEIEKKELANRFIEKIEIFPEERDNGSVIKSVTFRFPIKIGGKSIDKVEVNRQTSGNLVETVILMSRKDK